jgi:hypothetical protein
VSTNATPGADHTGPSTASHGSGCWKSRHTTRICSVLVPYCCRVTFPRMFRILRLLTLVYPAAVANFGDIVGPRSCNGKYSERQCVYGEPSSNRYNGLCLCPGEGPVSSFKLTISHIQAPSTIPGQAKVFIAVNGTVPGPTLVRGASSVCVQHSPTSRNWAGRDAGRLGGGLCAE